MPGNKAPVPKLWTGIFIIIILLTFCCFVMGQGLNSGTSVYLDRMGYGASLAGVFALTFSVTAALMRLAVGPLIDAGKTSLLVIVGIVILIVGTFLPVVIEFGGIPAYFVARVLQGAGFACATTAAATAAADILPQERLGEGIGYYGLGQALAMSVGPAFALYLVGTDPASNLYLGLSFVGVAGLCLACVARYERHPEKLPFSSAYRSRFEGRLKVSAKKETGLKTIFEPRALPGAIPMLIESSAFGFGIFFVGLYGTSLGVGNAGLFYTVSAISMIAVRLCSGRFMDTVAPIKVFTVAIACGLVAYVMLYFGGSNEWLFYLSGIPYGVCLGVSLPLNQSVSVKNTPPERWGATNALFLLFNDVGIGTASAIWGVINETLGFSVTIPCVMACLVVSYLLAWIAYPADCKKWKK